VKLVIVGAGMNVNTPADTTVPPGVVTVIFPVAPSDDTTAVICVADTTVALDAATPPKSTSVAPVKFVPVIVIVAPNFALVGVKLVMVGGEGTKVKPARAAVPPGVVACTLPLAPTPTTASICVGETTTKLAAFVPPKRTCVVPVRFVPVIVTVAPGEALVGVKLVIVGVRTKVKVATDVAIPPGVVT
jgi:hypothetical protein